MIGKCNLFKPVDCTTGTFFTFSQYAQDLTREYTQADAYRCVPSKFAALDLDIHDYTDKQLGQIFQNYFENSCTCLRPDDQWTPEASLPLLWRTLQKYGLITINEDLNSTCDNLKYIGDINIYSYTPTKDGIGYNEIYCYVPNSAQSTNYIFHEIQFPSSDPLIYPIPNSENCISGYEAQDTSTTYTGCHWLLEDQNDQGETTNLKYFDEASGERYYEDSGYVPDVLVDQPTETTIRPDESFTFNAVVVFYDIVTKGTEEDTIIHKNIPLGIFFTGKPENGSLTNPVTKFVNNEDIYNQGTSYGLRICSRFLCSPNLTKFENTEIYTTDNDDDLSQLMSMMADNCTLMADLSKEINNMNDGLTTHMACFRNNKTNVPYLRRVNNAWYWFVNGKNTGVAANAVNQQDIDNILTRLDAISIGLRQTVEGVINELWDQGELNIEPIPSTDISMTISHFQNILNGSE